MTLKHPFESFLDNFVPQVARKSKQVHKALWLLETTGSADAADLKADLDTEWRLLFNDAATYEKLIAWDQDPALKDSLLKRQLNILIRTFKQNLIPKALLEEISEKEAALSQSYAGFRPEIEGRRLSDNDIRDVLKMERDPQKRKKVWDASKKIGEVLAPQILNLVKLRNEAAKSLGYPDYFTMQLDLQEVDAKWLESTLEDLAKRSDAAYLDMLKEINQALAGKFQVSKEDLGPWAWSDTFCQEDPLGTQELDELVTGIDIAQTNIEFYKRMGVDVEPILSRSDMEERPKKNQHAFCIDMDREGDVRTLNNIRSSIKWLETLLHELGHAIYDSGYDKSLPWLLREPPHMITTEAMALIAGRQAYRYEALHGLIGKSKEKEPLMKKADSSLRRRQLIFSRWVLVMTAFEKELYKNPGQDLNKLWWETVEKYQKIQAPKGREGKSDWAAKYHIGLSPVYYFSYLLGEMFASAIEESLLNLSGTRNLDTEKAGRFFKEKLFFPGNRMKWSELIEFATGKPLSPDAWIVQFAS